MKNIIEVEVGFQCAIPWKEPIKSLEIVEIMRKYEGQGLSLKRYGSSGRRTFSIEEMDDEKIMQTWAKVGGGIFKAGSPWNFVVHVFFNKAPQPKATSSLWMRLDKDYFSSTIRKNEFVNLCKDIYIWGHMDHGYIAHENEYDSKNRFSANSGVGGANLKISLPGIYWVNFFGPRYVKWLGSEKFEELSTYKKEKLPDGGWMITTRSSVFNYNDPVIKKEETKVINHLGAEAFFEMRNPQKITKTPKFPWDESRI